MLNTPHPHPDALPPVSDAAGPLLDRATERGRDALQGLGHDIEGFATRSAGQIRQQAGALQALTAQELQLHPLRAVLVAGGAGVLLTLLLLQMLRR